MNPKFSSDEADRKFLVRTIEREILGPCSFEELAGWLREKRVSVLDEVCEAGKKWMPIKRASQFEDVISGISRHATTDKTVDLTQEFHVPSEQARVNAYKRHIVRKYEEPPKPAKGPGTTVSREQKIGGVVRKISAKRSRVISAAMFGAVLLVSVIYLLAQRGGERPQSAIDVKAPTEVSALSESFQNVYKLARRNELAALYSEAEKEYNNALKMAPGNASVQIRLAALAIQSKRDFKRAESILSKLADNGELTVAQKKEIANYRSVAALGLGDVDLAKTHADGAIVLDAKFAPAYFNLGKSLYLKKRYFDAKDAFETSLKRQPNEILSYIYLGKTFAASKQWKFALREFQNAVNVNKRKVLPEFFVAWALLNSDRKGDAISTLEGMALLDPDYEDHTLSDDQYSREANEYAEILPEFNMLMLDSSVSAGASAEIALLHFLHGDKERGLSILKRIVSSKTESATPHVLLGYLYQRQGNIDAAKDELRVALRYDYTSELAQTLLGDLLLGTGEASEALKHYHNVLGRNAFNIAALQGLAAYYFEQNDFTQAKSTESQILEIDPYYLPARRGLYKIEEMGY